MSRLIVRVVAAAAMSAACVASVEAQEPPPQLGRFITGPVWWTPTLQVREAGIDSNVFNSAFDPQEDVTAGFLPQLESVLKLPYLQMTNRGTVEYVYFEKYKSQRAWNRNVNTRIQVPMTRFQPTAFGSWSRAKDRTSSELDVRAPRTDYGYGAGFSTRVASRISLNAELDRLVTRYDNDQTFRGIDIATRLNHQTTFLTAGARMELTPFTSAGLDASLGSDEFDVKPSLDTENYRVALTFDFAPDAVIRGRASVGYHQMDPQHPNGEPDGAVSYSGVTSSIDLGYTLLGRTRFNPKLVRDTSYSVSAISPIFVSTAATMEIVHTLVGPVDLVVRGYREKLAFPATAVGGARTDHVTTLGGGISVRLPNQGRLMINYDNAQRDSSEGPGLGYERRHLYTTLTYGF